MCGCNKNKPKPTVVLPATRSFSAAADVATTESRLPTVDTSIWGPSLWKVLHIAAQTKGRQAQWKLILNTLLTGLPCPDCTAHYTTWYRAHPIGINLVPTRSRRPISIWLLDLHNNVNQRIGRPVWTVSQLDAAYRANQLQDAKDTLASLQGVIGQNTWTALNTLLNSL